MILHVVVRGFGSLCHSHPNHKEEELDPDYAGGSLDYAGGSLVGKYTYNTLKLKSRHILSIVL